MPFIFGKKQKKIQILRSPILIKRLSKHAKLNNMGYGESKSTYLLFGAVDRPRGKIN